MPEKIVFNTFLIADFVRSLVFERERSLLIGGGAPFGKKFDLKKRKVVLKVKHSTNLQKHNFTAAPVVLYPSRSKFPLGCLLILKEFNL